MMAAYPTIWLGVTWENGRVFPSVSVCLPPGEDGDEVVSLLEKYPTPIRDVSSQDDFSSFVARWMKYAQEQGYSFEFNESLFEQYGEKFLVAPQ
ncbi:MAG: hypothetical protein ACOYYI_09525 [Chloroflexota bacterium]|jgi:hypothetical protein